MKKTGIIYLLLLCLSVSWSQQKMYIHKSTGSLVNYNITDIDSITFATNDTQLIIHANQYLKN